MAEELPGKAEVRLGVGPALGSLWTQQMVGNPE